MFWKGLRTLFGRNSMLYVRILTHPPETFDCRILTLLQVQELATLRTAIDLDLFTYIADSPGPVSAQQIAEKTGASPVLIGITASSPSVVSVYRHSPSSWQNID